jgi:hypothetical protein
MTRQSLTRIVAGAAVAGVVSLAASPAFATTSSSTPPSPRLSSPTSSAAVLSKIQADARTAIDGRVAALTTVLAVLGGVKAPCDVAPLVATAQSDIAGLDSLETTILADTTVSQARSDAQLIFTKFRVYALVIPVDHLVRATCAVNDVVSRFTALETKWGALNDPNISTLLADMVSQTQAAGQAVNGLPTTVEGYMPADWNGNHTLLNGARSSVQTARQDLGKARADAKQIVGILRGEHHPAAAGSVSSSTTSTSVAG